MLTNNNSFVYFVSNSVCVCLLMASMSRDVKVQWFETCGTRRHDLSEQKCSHLLFLLSGAIFFAVIPFSFVLIAYLVINLTNV